MAKKLTKVRRKMRNRPKSIIQKYDRLRAANPIIDDLVKVFDLELKL